MTHVPFSFSSLSFGTVSMSGPWMAFRTFIPFLRRARGSKCAHNFMSLSSTAFSTILIRGFLKRSMIKSVRVPTPLASSPKYLPIVLLSPEALGLVPSKPSCRLHPDSHCQLHYSPVCPTYAEHRDYRNLPPQKYGRRLACQNQRRAG